MSPAGTLQETCGIWRRASPSPSPVATMRPSRATQRGRGARTPASLVSSEVSAIATPTGEEAALSSDAPTDPSRAPPALDMGDIVLDAMEARRASENPPVGASGWRALRSRTVMRQLTQLSAASSKSLKLAELEKRRSSSGKGVPNPNAETRADDAGGEGGPGAGGSSSSLRANAPAAPPAAPPVAAADADAAEEDLLKEDLDELEDKLAAWLQCSGLHTVDKWVLNYKKHPSCWAALLMMHGVPEVSGRLRAKVENYAIYSALFLSCTIQSVMNPPAVMDCVERELEGASRWRCEATRRVSVYALLGSVAMHLYAIVLAMAFVNALNETAREADVFRIFARGQGYLATFKCQQAFRRGAGFCIVAMTAVALETLGWDAVAWIAALGWYVIRNFTYASDLLFKSGSLVNYWRKELGGCPDEDDPYEIDAAVHVFKERVKFSRGLLGDEHYVRDEHTVAESDGKIWQGKGEDRRGETGGGGSKRRSFVSSVRSSLRSSLGGSPGTSGGATPGGDGGGAKTEDARSAKPRPGVEGAAAAAAAAAAATVPEDAPLSLDASDDLASGSDVSDDAPDASALTPEQAEEARRLRKQRKRRKNKEKRQKGYFDQHHGTHVGSKAVALL